MNFQFKIQDYQSEAVESTVAVFTGQRHQDPLRYGRDLGTLAQEKSTMLELGMELLNDDYHELDAYNKRLVKKIEVKGC